MSKGGIIMKNKSLKITALILSVLLPVLILSSCGSAKSMADYADETGESYDYGYAVNASEQKSVSYDESNSGKGDTQKQNGNAMADAESRKLIRNAELSAETKDFEKFNNDIETEINKAGGYIESSNVSGNSYDSFSNRYADITIRIPAEKLDAFLSTVGNLANITSKNISLKDITADYIDTEARIRALESEQKALLAILEKATKVSEIIEVQDRLTDVNAELDSYKSQLRTFDKLVSYSTVRIHINEVDRVSPSGEKTGFFTEIKNRLSDNLYNVGQGLRSFVIFIISSLPYIAIIAVIIIVIIIIIRKIIRKRKIRKAKENAQSGQQSS